MKKSPFKINPKIILNISVRLAVFFVILSFLFSFFRLYKENRAEERMDSEHVYFDLQQESSPFSSSVEEYTELYAKLCSSSLYDYYECYPQYLEGLPVSQSFFDYETEALSENCQAALCVQISENLQYNSHLTCDAGRLLNGKDYQLAGETVPVLLGYEYRNLFQLGDQFSAVYLYNVYTFEVVGFLEKGAKIYNPAHMIYLDKYIIMPSFNVFTFPENTDGIKIHCANKTSGVLTCRKDDFAYVSGHIKQLIANAGCGNYSVNISPVKYSFMEKTGIRVEWFIAFLSAAALLFALSCIKYMRETLI